MGNLGATEILLIFLVILLLFGAKRIPEIARGLGKGIREFKDATTDIKRELTVDEQMRLNQPQYGGQPRDQRPYDQQAYPPSPAYPPQAAYDPTAHPPMPQGSAPQHPAYGPPADPNHPAYGSTPPQNS